MLVYRFILDLLPLSSETTTFYDLHSPNPAILDPHQTSREHILHLDSSWGALGVEPDEGETTGAVFSKDWFKDANDSVRFELS